MNGLSPAEEAIARLLVDGFSNQEIGERLGKSPQTVRNQLTKVYARLGVRNRVELVVWWMKQNRENGGEKWTDKS